MVCFFSRLALQKLSLAVGAFLALPSWVLAQRPVGPLAPAPPPVHGSVPFIYRAPATAPIMRPPAMTAPVYMPFRSRTIPSGAAVTVRPPFRPVRPRPPVFFVYTPPLPFEDPFWRFGSCWWANCDQFWPWTFGAFSVSSPGPINYVLQTSESPVYVVGTEDEETPQLFLSDGTILNVTDYWVVDNQLHFTMIEQASAPAVEHSIPFEELDVQKSIDANTRRGFRFVLRNEPVAQYMQDHPEEPPPLAVPPKP